jgi:multiple sugar transport system substrate-binding protein
MNANRTTKALMSFLLLALVAAGAPASAATPTLATQSPETARLAAATTSAPVTLKIAWMGATMKVYRAWKERFEAENPGVTIEYQFIPYAEGPTVYNTMIQGGNTPDLAYLFMGMIPEYVERKALLALDDYMKPDERANWVPAALDAAQYKGKIYGVPLIAANRTLYVRTDLMKAAGYSDPPKTWDQVRDLARKMNKPPAVYGMCVGFGRPKHIMQEQISMMWGYGADFFDKDGKLTVNSPAAIKYVTDLTDLFLKDKVMAPSNVTMNANECYAAMAAGKVGMMFSLPGQTKMCADNKLDCLPIPNPEPLAGGKKNMLLIVDIFGMFANSRNKEVAYKFIQLVQRPENRQLMDVEFGGVPVTMKVGADPYYQSPPLKDYIAQTSTLKLTPKHPEWTKIQDGWGEAAQKVITGDLTPEKSLNALYERLMRQLEVPNLPR